MWLKSLTLLGFTFLAAPWPRAWPPGSQLQHVLAFEMDDSNETLAEEFQKLTSEFDINQEIEKQIRKSFKKNPFADSEIDLAAAANYEESFSTRMTTTTTASLLPLEPTTDEYRQEALNKVNEFRKQHCVPPLTMNAWLNMQADTYAQHALVNHAFIPQVAGTKLGENTYIKEYPHGEGSGGVGGEPSPPHFNPSTVVLNAIENWYRERYDYDFQNPAFHFGLGKPTNFTNLVWKSSRNVGLGLASNDKELIIVALFYPPGFWNNPTTLRQNVLPTEAEKGGDVSHAGNGGGSGLPAETLQKMLEHSNLYF